MISNVLPPFSVHSVYLFQFLVYYHTAVSQEYNFFSQTRISQVEKFKDVYLSEHIEKSHNIIVT